MLNQSHHSFTIIIPHSLFMSLVAFIFVPWRCALFPLVMSPAEPLICAARSWGCSFELWVRRFTLGANVRFPVAPLWCRRVLSRAWFNVSNQRKTSHNQTLHNQHESYGPRAPADASRESLLPDFAVAQSPRPWLPPIFPLYFPQVINAPL